MAWSQVLYLLRPEQVIEGVIYYCGKVFVPVALRQQVLSDAHLALPHMHPGSKKTKSTILRMFNWPNECCRLRVQLFDMPTIEKPT